MACWMTMGLELKLIGTLVEDGTYTNLQPVSAAVKGKKSAPSMKSPESSQILARATREVGLTSAI